MELHSRQSLYEIHGISDAPPRRQKRRRPLARLAIARVLAVLKRIKAAIEAELAARYAITELASMNDHMLRDLGITRSDIGTRCGGREQMPERMARRSSRTRPARAIRPCRRSALPILHLKDSLNRDYRGCAHGDRCKGVGVDQMPVHRK
jgi:uncharacterized protein YjiS (DUF1127 family)